MTSLPSLRSAPALLASLVLSATAALAGDNTTAAKPAAVASLESFSLRTPVLNDDGSTTLPDGSVIAAPVHASVNADGSVTFANGETISAPTTNADGTITLSDGTVVNPAKLSASTPGARSLFSGVLEIKAE